MQIVIPMSGFGERFRQAGYSIPKPLIEIEGKPIIAHVVDMFPDETEFVFICNTDHLDHPEYCMEDILRKICPTGRILRIAPHNLGPVNAVRQAEHMLDMDRPVIVNYCDFTCYWDWFDFKRFVLETKCVGSIPAYKGFHPHSLGNTNYAYMREKDGWVLDIQEKQPYSDNRMEEYASSGTYYFSTAREMSVAFASVMDQGYNVGGEYYVSLAFKPIIASGKSVAVYPLQHFMQWGTPKDVDEYNMWSAAFARMANDQAVPVEPKGSLIVPMAGLGQRFALEGYLLTKPLIPVSGRPMALQAIGDLPRSEQQIFILRKDMQGYKDVSAQLMKNYPNSVIKTIDKVTEGQACTALIGLDVLQGTLGAEEIGPVTIGACDNGVLYDETAFADLTQNEDVDVIVWGVRGYSNASRNPHMFGWIDEKKGNISKISVKKPLGNPTEDPIILGTFTFVRPADFRACVDRLIARNGRINGEFYIDSCLNDAIEMGLRCRLFEVDSYLCWGTPNDLRTFEYWQSCFHKWGAHPYRLENDARVSTKQIAPLETKFTTARPEVPVLRK